MRKMIACFSLLVLLISTSGCAALYSKREYKEVQKSPCVDNGGPCKHIPINNWWLPESRHIKYNA